MHCEFKDMLEDACFACHIFVYGKRLFAFSFNKTLWNNDIPTEEDEQKMYCNRIKFLGDNAIIGTDSEQLKY